MKKYFSSYWIRSAFFAVLQRFSLTLFGFINFIIIIREFKDQKDKMGIWALFLIVTGIFETVKTNLLKNAHIKYASATTEPGEKTGIASSSLVINMALTAVFILFTFFFAGSLSRWLNTGTDLATMLYWFTPGLVFMIFFSHLECVQQSHLDFKGVFAGYFVRQILLFAAIAFHKIAGIPFTLVHLAVYQSASMLFGTIMLYIFSRKYLSMRFNPSMFWIRKITGYGGYIFGSGTVAAIFLNLDQLMIAKFMQAPQVASYNTASRINALVDVPSHAAAEVLFPKASRASSEEGPERIKYFYERMVAILLSLTIPTALFIIAFPAFVIQIIAGPQYLEAAPILQLNMITGIMRPAQHQAANLLNSIGKPKLCFYLNAGCLLLNLLVTYFCIRQFGFYGAAIGPVITFTLTAFAWYFIMRKVIHLDLRNVAQHGADVYKMSFRLLTGFFSRKTKPVHL